VHGVADLVTPYFVTKLLLDQLPAFGDSPRIRLVVLPGGHMSYIRDDSRRALRDDARTLIEQK
jgi:carboxypeptidase C (cathepsin A)